MQLFETCLFINFELRREGMMAGMGVSFQTGSGMGMKFEISRSGNGNILMGMKGN